MGKRYTEALYQTIFLGPAMLLYAVVTIVPFVLSLIYSMSDWNGISKSISWVGFSNYADVLSQDDGFYHSFWFTTKLTVVITLLTNVLGFALACILTMPLKLRNAWRTVFFLPNVLGGLLLGFVWQFIFTKGFAAIGQLTHMPLFNLPWLGTEQTAFWGLVIVTVWQSIGYVMVIYIAGISNVPREIREAATMDGANGWISLSRITLPLIMPSITVCLFWTVNWTYKMFDVNFALTGGGPYNSSQSIAYNIYIEAFQKNHYGMGSAKAVLFFLAVALITLVQVYVTKRREVEL